MWCPQVRLLAADINSKGATEEAVPEEIVVEPPQPGADNFWLALKPNPQLDPGEVAV